MATETFDGYTVTSNSLSQSQCKLEAVDGRLKEIFGVDDVGIFSPPDIAVVQAWAARFINTYAGELRTKIGTDIPFQGDVYQLKETEAKAFATDNAPDATKYPVMFAEAAARQMKPADVAAEYLHNSQAWPVLLAQIEALRLGSLSKLQAAKSIADVEAVLGALE